MHSTYTVILKFLLVPAPDYTWNNLNRDKSGHLCKWESYTAMILPELFLSTSMLFFFLKLLLGGILPTCQNYAFLKKRKGRLYERKARNYH